MNKKKKSIPLITAGFVLLLVGVILFVFGISTNVPEMGGSGWFETSSRKTMFMFIGGALILFSSILLTVAFKGKINNSLSLTRTLHNEIFNNFQNKFKEKKCEYCGTICEPTEKNCPNCSAALKKQQ